MSTEPLKSNGISGYITSNVKCTFCGIKFTSFKLLSISIVTVIILLILNTIALFLINDNTNNSDGQWKCTIYPSNIDCENNINPQGTFTLNSKQVCQEMTKDISIGGFKMSSFRTYKSSTTDILTLNVHPQPYCQTTTVYLTQGCGCFGGCSSITQRIGCYI